MVTMVMAMEEMNCVMVLIIKDLMGLMEGRKVRVTYIERCVHHS